MRKVKRTKRAGQDLMAIWRYIAVDSPEAASKQLEAIEQKCGFLLQHPRIGSCKNDIRNGALTFPCDDYIILYRETPDGIEIVRVIHDARDLRLLN